MYLLDLDIFILKREGDFLGKVIFCIGYLGWNRVLRWKVINEREEVNSFFFIFIAREIIRIFKSIKGVWILNVVFFGNKLRVKNEEVFFCGILWRIREVCRFREEVLEFKGFILGYCFYFTSECFYLFFIWYFLEFREVVLRK